MSDSSDFMYEYSRSFVGPVMYNYTMWILEQAQNRGIKRIYFLARDGYLLHRIAEKICCEKKLSVECRYLYCSRLALRLPSFCRIGEETFDLLLQQGYYSTPRNILARSLLTEEETECILDELGVSGRDDSLNAREFSAYADRLRNCSLYRKLVMEKSEAAYPLAIGYLWQEGLLDGGDIAIADSGWTGSMQRSLRQLLESVGFLGKLSGFYFGMFAEPHDPADGEYFTFYFSAKEHIKNKLFFNNNLFECMLSANHGMTVGYVQNGERFEPIFAKDQNEDMKMLIERQIEGALKYTDMRLAQGGELTEKEARHECFRLLKRCMVYPTRREAELYSRFLFCDDVTEGYSLSLANDEMRRYLKQYLIHYRIYKKLFRPYRITEHNLFWPYGVIAFCPAIVRPWYRLNMIVGDWLKFKFLMK